MHRTVLIHTHRDLSRYTLLVGKPPFQTKDVKDIYRCVFDSKHRSRWMLLLTQYVHRNIKDNNYDFPSNLELSVEAVDLVRSILTPVPTARPTLLEILAHDFFTTGPFPPHITPPASREGQGPEGQGPEDWSLMSIRSAHRNFEAVKRRAGITYEMEDEAHALRDLAATASSASNATIVPQQQTSASMKPRRSVPLEPVQEEAAPPASQRASARPTATDRADVRQQAVQEVEDEDAAVVAKGGMEREVKKALAPESPISDLLRSARKPLMVSPRTTASKTSKSAGASLEDHNAGSLEPRDVLQRRMVSEARSSSRRSTKPSSGSELPVEREAGRTGTSGGRENEAPSNAAATTMTSRHRRSAMTAVSAMKAPSAEAVTKGSTTKAEPISSELHFHIYPRSRADLSGCSRQLASLLENCTMPRGGSSTKHLRSQPRTTSSHSRNHSMLQHRGCSLRPGLITRTNTAPRIRSRTAPQDCTSMTARPWSSHPTSGISITFRIAKATCILVGITAWRAERIRKNLNARRTCSSTLTITWPRP